MLPALILGAVLIGGCVPAPQEAGTRRWSCRSEVYQLAVVEGVLVAKTSGGNFALENGRVKGFGEMPAPASNDEVPAAGDGAFLSATTRFNGQLVASYWGGKSIFSVGEDGLESLFKRPPAEGDYALATFKGKLYAGTNRGLFVREDNDWKYIDLGGELPFARVHGAAKIGNDVVLGGIDGVAIGRPGAWKFVSREPVRQVLQVRNDVWIVYGSGAVDKLAEDGKLHSDVLFGTAKRPWTSVAVDSKPGLFLGGMGGWVVKGSAFAELYPAELKGQVVTAMAYHEGQLYIGTQTMGIARVTSVGLRWINPGNGLADTWVTALLPHRGKLYAATATAGLFEVGTARAAKIATPSEKLRHLAVFRSELTIGALDGAWRRGPTKWEKLKTDSQETTFLSLLSDELWVGTPIGVYIIR